jgi:hypothetical protein
VGANYDIGVEDGETAVNSPLRAAARNASSSFACRSLFRLAACVLSLDAATRGLRVGWLLVHCAP